MALSAIFTMTVGNLGALRSREVKRLLAWSSIAHGLVMAGQATVDVAERTHLVGDVPALVAIGAALLFFAPSRVAAARRQPTG